MRVNCLCADSEQSLEARHMKILFIHSSGDNLAGSEIAINRLINLLGPEFDCKMLLPKAGVFHEFLKANRVNTSLLPLSGFNWKSPFSYLKGMLKLFPFIRKESPDLIHLTSASPMQWAYPIAKLLRIPIICHLHTAYREDDKRRYFPQRADFLIFVSKYIKKNFGTNVSRKSQLLYNGIPQYEGSKSFASIKLRREFLFEADQLVVGMVGQIIYRKGIDLFLHAAAKVKRRVGGVKFLIVGSERGHYAVKMKELAHKLGLESDLVWTGFRPDRLELMAGMDLMVVPSRSEGFGLVAAEALSVGCPVIASNSGGLREIIKDQKNGIILPKLTATLLSKKIVLLLNSPALMNGMTGLDSNRYTQNFSEKKMKEKMEKIYHETKSMYTQK